MIAQLTVKHPCNHNVLSNIHSQLPPAAAKQGKKSFFGDTPNPGRGALAPLHSPFMSVSQVLSVAGVGKTCYNLEKAGRRINRSPCCF